MMKKMQIMVGAHGQAQIRFLVLALFLTLSALGGGVFRATALSLLYLRPAALLCIAFTLLSPGQRDFAGLKWPLTLLGFYCVYSLLTLVPLPPTLWLSLPGHAGYAEAAAAAGLPQPWRPLTLSPDGTINALLAMLPSAAIFFALAGLDRKDWPKIATILLVLCCLSAILGVVQNVTSPFPTFYLYEFSDIGIPTGFFANHNHQALFLAIGLPLLFFCVERRRNTRISPLLFYVIAGVVAALLIVAVLRSLSRTGLALAMLALVGIFIGRIFSSAREPKGARSTIAAGVGKIAIFAVPTAMLVVGAWLSSDSGFNRLTTTMLNIGEEQRLYSFPTTLQIIRDFLPFGAGQGTFEMLFKQYEPDAQLQPLYFNHAHNDLLEILLTGGIPAGLILVGFLGWLTSRLIFLARNRRDGNEHMALARLGMAIVAMILAASITDYPVRTPLISVVLAIACGWIGGGRLSDQGERHSVAIPTRAV